MQQYSTVSCAASKACSNCTCSADLQSAYEHRDEDEDNDSTFDNDDNTEDDLMMAKVTTACNAAQRCMLYCSTCSDITLTVMRSRHECVVQHLL
jgi:hypothetical protein